MPSGGLLSMYAGLSGCDSSQSAGGLMRTRYPSTSNSKAFEFLRNQMYPLVISCGRLVALPRKFFRKDNNLTSFLYYYYIKGDFSRNPHIHQSSVICLIQSSNVTDSISSPSWKNLFLILMII